MEAKKDLLYNKFVNTIKDRIPERGKLTTFLVDLLCIEKEAVYRRLRGEVPFTFAEIALIAERLDFSLDSIIRENQATDEQPFHLKLVNFEKPSETDFFVLENYIKGLEDARNDPNSETGIATNILPITLCIAYKNLFRFSMMKWMYQLGESEIVPFSEINPSDRMLRVNQKILTSARNIGRTFFVWDRNVLNSFVNDIHYFSNIRLINKKEIDLIKNDLFLMLNEMERIAITGEYDTGKKVEIYVSSLNFETSYSYVQSNNYELTIIRSFTLNDTTSMNKAMFTKIKRWMNAIVRTSTLISGSNEVERILFFERQREILSRI